MMLIMAAFQLVFLGLSVGHHDPKMTHEGDKMENFDFGLHQINIIYEREFAKSNVFVSLTTFGDHLMHHVFPTLDHAVLPQMSEVFLETCRDFNIEVKSCTMLEGFVGQLKQLRLTKHADDNKIDKISTT
jgi:fatty acid desaturase